MTALNADPRQAYLRAEARKRSALALGVSAAFYLLALAALWIFGLLRPIEYSEYAGPVLIRLGIPEGSEVPAPELPPAPEPVPEAVRPPEPTPAPAASVPAPPPDQTARVPAAKVPGSPPPSPTPIVPSTEGAVAGPIKGDEHGNSHETTFDATEGRVGRSLYVPIWTFMPLPRTVEDRVYSRIQGDGFRTAVERKNRFRNYYEFESPAWKLKQDVPLDLRQGIWLILESGGYDLARAEYKTGRALAPVQLRFRVGPAQGNRPPVLESVELVESSGDPDIDAAVLFGFSRASFSNDSDKSVTGRFTYRF
ncbi:MAG: hypothetical protein GX430_09680 [Treponema sp.]|nr:hypothetical protein [Treponema sp.]